MVCRLRSLLIFFSFFILPLQVGLAAASALAEEEAPQLQVILFLIYFI